MRAMSWEKGRGQHRRFEDEGKERDRKRTNLGNNLEPGIDGNRAETLHDSARDLVDVTIFEPERQKTKRILEGVAGRESDGSEEG
jgi:hypothetical protein